MSPRAPSLRGDFSFIDRYRSLPQLTLKERGPAVARLWMTPPRLDRWLRHLAGGFRPLPSREKPAGETPALPSIPSIFDTFSDTWKLE